MKQYLDLLRDVRYNGRGKSDRTGTGTRSVFGRQIRMNLAEGFPLLTTKKVFFRGVLAELLWILSGDTNEHTLRDQNVNIWKEWRQPYTLEREVVLVDARPAEVAPTYTGDFSYAGIDVAKDSVDGKLASAWVKMMKRCYDPQHHRWSLYGGAGATVCERWHTLANFLEDVKTLPHWEYKERNWNGFELDKDYYGARQYGPSTSVWLSTEENNLYTTAAIPVRVVDMDGTSHIYLSCTQAEAALGMSSSSIRRAVKGNAGKPKGNNKRFVGWFFEAADAVDKLWRLELIPSGDLGRVYGSMWRDWQSVGPNGETKHTDQIANLLTDLKNNPTSRRHLVTAWNPGELDQMALPPCHCLFQFYCEELTTQERAEVWFQKGDDCQGRAAAMRTYKPKPGEDYDSEMDDAGVPSHRLSCQLYQRSADIFLGVPFNIASYAALTMMIAQVVNMIPGDFVHTFGDLHIYNNHLDQVDEQLSREPRPLPRLFLNPNVKDLFAFQMADFTLDGYDPHPAIKAEVAV